MIIYNNKNYLNDFRDFIIIDTCYYNEDPIVYLRTHDYNLSDLINKR